MVEQDVERTLGYLVKRVQQSLRRRCDAALRPTGLSMAQYAVLRALADHPRASAADLARRCFITRQSLQDLLVALRSAGLVTDSDGSPRGRARALALTAAGAEMLTRAHDAVMTVEADMAEGISVSAYREAAAALTRCAENLEVR